MIIGVTGAKCSGKSQSLMKVASILKENKVSVGGIISRRIWKDSVRQGYELINIHNGQSQVLASATEVDDEWEKFCTFFFRKKAVNDGIDAIIKGCNADVLIIDEIGNMEIDGGGWSRSFSSVAKRVKPTIISVRDGVIDKLGSWGLAPDKVITMTEGRCDVSAEIIDILEMSR